MGLFAGSFDPIHLDHLDAIERAAGIIEALVVAAVGNPDKSAGMLSLSQREMLIARATGHVPNVRTVSHYGLTTSLAPWSRCVLAGPVGCLVEIRWMRAGRLRAPPERTAPGPSYPQFSHPGRSVPRSRHDEPRCRDTANTC